MITTNIPQVVAMLDGMAARMAKPEPAMAIIGQRARADMERRIQRTKVDPDGDAWAPWRPATRGRREAKGNAGQGLLWDQGTLLGSIYSRSTDSRVDVGADTPYDGFLQDGTSRMEARPFAGWNDDDTHAAELTMLHYIEGAL